MQSQPNRRRRYFIDKKVQGKMIAIAVVLILVVFIGALIPLLLFQPAADMPQEDLAKLSSDFNNILLILLFVVGGVLIWTVFYGIRLTHRIVGPIYAFSRQMNMVRDGVYSKDLRIRAKDEFQNLALVFNAMLAAVRRRANRTTDVCAKVELNMTELEASLSQGDVDVQQAKNMIDALKEELTALRKENEKYISND